MDADSRVDKGCGSVNATLGVCLDRHGHTWAVGRQGPFVDSIWAAPAHALHKYYRTTLADGEICIAAM